MPRPGTANARGYGAPHRAIRAALLHTAPGSACTRCGLTIEAGDPIDLDHNDTRTAYLGWAHRSCNRSAGATKGNHERAGTGLPTSESW